MSNNENLNDIKQRIEKSHLEKSKKRIREDIRDGVLKKQVVSPQTIWNLDLIPSSIDDAHSLSYYCLKALEIRLFTMIWIFSKSNQAITSFSGKESVMEIPFFSAIKR